MSVYKVKPFLGDGGSGGGSEIVDALPASGKEGSTYLLRKTEESEGFKVHFYRILLTNFIVPGWTILVGEGDIEAQLQEALEKRLDPSLGEGVVNFEQIVTGFTSLTPEEFEESINGHNVAFVETEEEVLAINEDKEAVIQDLGEIGVEDILIEEYRTSDGDAYLAGMYGYLPNTLLEQELYRDNEVVNRNRSLDYNGPEVPVGSTLYSFTEWDESVDAQLVGTLTDTYEYNSEVLEPLNEYDTYHIVLTPEQPTYSYTQYVFDKGVYTEISGAGGSGNVATITKFEDNNTFKLDKTDDELIELFNSNNNGPIWIRNPEPYRGYGAMIYNCGTLPDNPSNYFFAVASLDLIDNQGGGTRYYYENNQWKYELLE